MLKKSLLLTVAFAIALATVPMFAAFEAHVINVTAKIENALNVPIEPINFGTVFPQEQLDREINVSLSQSFVDEPRVDDVQYIIRQKPKCAWTQEDGTILVDLPTATGHVIPDGKGGYTIECPDPAEEIIARAEEINASYGVLPSLCPYLSKHKADEDTQEQELEINAFHQPFIVGTSTIQWIEAKGYLTKFGNDTTDTWNIDLKVPCFGDYCAQDWADFVTRINPDAEPGDYVQDIANEHKIFGCDLWVEVTGVSEAIN